MNRSQMREQAFILIFEREFSKDVPLKELEEIYTETNEKLSDYALEVFEGCFDNIDDIDKTISLYLRSWRIERIAKVSLAILRLAFYEIKYCENIPENISASEAVNLAKKYSSQREASFVNGIIGNYLRSRDKSLENNTIKE